MASQKFRKSWFNLCFAASLGLLLGCSGMTSGGAGGGPMGGVGNAAGQDQNNDGNGADNTLTTGTTGLSGGSNPSSQVGEGSIPSRGPNTGGGGIETAGNTGASNPAAQTGQTGAGKPHDGPQCTSDISVKIQAQVNGVNKNCHDMVDQEMVEVGTSTKLLARNDSLGSGSHTVETIPILPEVQIQLESGFTDPHAFDGPTQVDYSTTCQDDGLWHTETLIFFDMLKEDKTCPLALGIKATYSGTAGFRQSDVNEYRDTVGDGSTHEVLLKMSF